MNKLISELKQHWRTDIMSGFLVSLIALPLCLGIAAASNFPPIMGVMTAIVGGLVVTLFAGSHLTIKGPAAGLIVILAGAVEAFGGGEIGWHLALGVVVVSGLLQIVFGKLKFAKFADIFPISSVHGMLAAIGIIIISRQIHLLLGEDPAILKGKSPIELIEMIPHAFTVFNNSILLIGAISLAILFIWPKIPVAFLKKVPAALVVLIGSVTMAAYFHLSDPEFAGLKPLVNPGTFSLNWNVDFSGIFSNTTVFFEYLLMFVLIGSLEALLTNKAIDLMTPNKPKSDSNKDLSAIGIGNSVSGILGGLPMISEVARSSSNVMNGAQSRWSNFFHGVFLLLYVLVLTPVIKMVPVAALSAMLIYVGLRLASAKEFRHAWSLGKDQFLIFFATIIVCLLTDLLLGVFTGVFIKIVLHFARGLSAKELFKTTFSIEEEVGLIKIQMGSSVIFTNVINLRKRLAALPVTNKTVIDVSNARIVDHSAQQTLIELQKEYAKNNRELLIVGLENHKRSSSHELSTAYLKKSHKLGSQVDLN